MSQFNFNLCVPFKMLVKMIEQYLENWSLPKELARSIAKYGFQTPFDQLNDYFPEPYPSSLIDGTSYLLLFSPFAKDIGTSFYFSNHETYTFNAEGCMVPTYLAVRAKIQLRKFKEGQDYLMAQLAVTGGNPLHGRTMEEKAYACYFGALGGNIDQILRWLETETSVYAQNLLTVFAVLGFAMAHGGGEIMPQHQWVIDKVYAFLEKNKLRRGSNWFTPIQQESQQAKRKRARF
jgi:hypothetical protein